MPSNPPLTESQRLIVDEAGKLILELAPFYGKQKRLDELKPLILNWYPNLGALEAEIAVGNTFEVHVGQKTIVKSWLSMDAVSAAVGGWEAFKKVCTVTYTALSESPLGIKAAQALQTESRTGYRKMKAVAIVSVPCERELPVELPKAA